MFTITEIIEITGAVLLQGEAKGEITGVSTDSRRIRPGELFIALRGGKFDGHDFLGAAFQKGAAAALVSAPPREAVKGCLLQAADTLLALGALAAAWRRRFSPIVIGVTGSVGKTTTKEMIASILSQSAEVLKTPENFNNEIGVPLTALNLRQEHKAAVFELAMRGRGQIRYLAEIISPDIGVITNIGLSHLELLSDRRAIAETKAELLEVMGKKGFAVLPEESEYISLLKEKSGRAVTFGLSRGEVCAREIVSKGESVDFQLWLPSEEKEKRGKGKWLSVRLPVPGKHNVVNALAAAAAARCAGASPGQIKRGLEAFMSVAGRMRILKAPAGFTILDDTYNASPDSMRAALETLAEMEGGGKIAVLGEMRELGTESAALHRAIGREAAEHPLALLVTVGELGKEIASGAADSLSSAAIESAADAPVALKLLSKMVRKGDVVLVKASRALGLEAVVKGLMALKKP
jgi:UDP-N-acetylmuramoyl-tripeptide--D-alanyl-D-alanine ligase